MNIGRVLVAVFLFVGFGVSTELDAQLTHTIDIGEVDLGRGGGGIRGVGGPGGGGDGVIDPSNGRAPDPNNQTWMRDAKNDAFEQLEMWMYLTYPEYFPYHFFVDYWQAEFDHLSGFGEPVWVPEEGRYHYYINFVTVEFFAVGDNRDGDDGGGDD